MTRKKPVIAILFILLQSLLYGFGDPISKTAYDTVSVYSLLTVRYWIAFAALMLLFGKRVVANLRACDWKRIILPSVCIALTFLISNLAINLTSPTSVAFLRSTATILTPLLALVAFRRTYSRKHIPILIVVLVGLYLLCNPGSGWGFGLGEALALLSALLAAGSLVFAEDALEKVDALTVTTVQAGTSVVLASICALAFEGGVHVAGAGSIVWLTILYLALTCTLGGYLLQNCALRHVHASTVALLQCTYPVMTAVFSFFLLHERLSIGGIVGALIIIACVVAENILNIKENKQEKS